MSVRPLSSSLSRNWFVLGDVARLTPSKLRLSFLIQLEVALYAVHGDCEDVHEAEVLGVLREYGCEPA